MAINSVTTRSRTAAVGLVDLEVPGLTAPLRQFGHHRGLRPEGQDLPQPLDIVDHLGAQGGEIVTHLTPLALYPAVEPHRDAGRGHEEWEQDQGQLPGQHGQRRQGEQRRHRRHDQG